MKVRNPEAIKEQAMRCKDLSHGTVFRFIGSTDLFMYNDVDYCIIDLSTSNIYHNDTNTEDIGIRDWTTHSVAPVDCEIVIKERKKYLLDLSDLPEE